MITMILVTALTIIAGSLLWISEDDQVLNPYEAWSRGPDDAAVSIHTFTDFT